MAKDRLLGKKTLHIGGFLDEFEKDDIKRKVDIVRLFEHFGIRLKKKSPKLDRLFHEYYDDLRDKMVPH